MTDSMDYKAAYEEMNRLIGKKNCCEVFFYPFSEAEEEAIKSALIIAQRMQWQPIETAPKDGRFLCFEHVRGRPDMTMVDFFDPAEWVNGAPPFATHWMPLPAAPDVEGV